MPIRRSYASSRKKKRYSRRYARRAKANVALVPRSMGSGIPDRITTTLKYYEAVSRTSTAGAFTSYFFSANGLYDPNTTGTGHQPMYFDQLTSMYNHYIVHSSYIAVKIIPFNTTGSSSGTAVIMGDDAASLTTSTISSAIEQKGAKWCNLPIYEDNQVYERTLRHSYNKRRVFKNYKNTELVGTASANPAEGWYYVIALRSDDNATTTTWLLKCQVHYRVTFFERKDIAPS